MEKGQAIQCGLWGEVRGGAVKEGSVRQGEGTSLGEG